MESHTGTKSTDLQSLRDAIEAARPEPDDGDGVRSLADLAVSALIPIMIFSMMLCVTWFLLDIRFVYTERLDLNMRAFAFFFVLGIVALNRLRAERGLAGSAVYMVGLMIAVGVFTVLSQTRGGGMAGGHLSSAFVSLCFNISVVAVLWKVTDRLTRDCCVDATSRYGEEGILRGGWFQRKAAALPQPELPHPSTDPRHGRPPRKHPANALFYLALPIMGMLAIGQRILPQGGGLLESAGSVYVGGYTASLLMLLLLSSYRGLRVYCTRRQIPFPTSIAVFWLGLGSFMVLLVLIMGLWGPVPTTPTSLAQQARLYDSAGRTLSDQWDYHEHQRPGEEGKGRSDQSQAAGAESRQGEGESGEGQESEGREAGGESPGREGGGNGDQEGAGQDPGASGTSGSDGEGPGPSEDGGATDEASGETATGDSGQGHGDANTPSSSGQAGGQSPAAEIPMKELMSAAPALKWLGYGALAVVALFILYALFQIGAHFFGRASKGPSRFAGLFDRLARLFRRLTYVPKRKPRRPRVRIDRDIATCAAYQNPLDGPMSLREKIQYSYDALCALAYDLGVPRDEDQTPFEFLSALPEPIEDLREEAHTLTYHYVAGSYSTLPIPETVLDDLRAFWRRFERMRGRVVR